MRENGIRPLNCGDACACICVDVDEILRAIVVPIYPSLFGSSCLGITSPVSFNPPSRSQIALPDLYYTHPIIRLSYAIWTSQETNSFYSSNCVSHSSIFFVYFATNIPVFNISTHNRTLFRILAFTFAFAQSIIRYLDYLCDFKFFGFKEKISRFNDVFPDRIIIFAQIKNSYTS